MDNQYLIESLDYYINEVSQEQLVIAANSSALSRAEKYNLFKKTIGADPNKSLIGNYTPDIPPPWGGNKSISDHIKNQLKNRAIKALAIANQPEKRKEINKLYGKDSNLVRRYLSDYTGPIEIKSTNKPKKDNRGRKGGFHVNPELNKNPNRIIKKKPGRPKKEPTDLTTPGNKTGNKSKNRSKVTTYQLLPSQLNNNSKIDLNKISSLYDSKAASKQGKVITRHINDL